MFHAQGWATATVLIAKLGFGGLAQADTLDVPDEFATIQVAIDFATDGDEVVIAPGEYFENINFKGKAITVRSTDPTNPAIVLVTIINGGGRDTVVTCDSGEGEDAVLSGLLITNGSATLGGGMVNGIGSSPTVTNCAFSGNSALSGGGMFNVNGSPTVTNCTFSGNTAASGGGMFNTGVSPITANRTGGDRMRNKDGRPTVTHCTFTGNTAELNGGGMYNVGISPTVTDCTFSGNTAADGGGLYNDFSSSPTVTHCAFIGNTAEFEGGGLYIIGGSSAVRNCMFTGNTAGLVGGGMFSDFGTPTLTNSVLCRNTPDQLGGEPIIGAGGNAISADHCIPLPPADTESDCDVADVNGDGLVDPLDVGFVLARFGCAG